MAKLRMLLRKQLHMYQKIIPLRMKKRLQKCVELVIITFQLPSKKQTGQTFRDFLEAVKIQNARKLLLSTEQSITEIAYEVRYSSTSYFISRFKKQCDITPKQFRKKTLDVKVRGG